MIADNGKSAANSFIKGEESTKYSRYGNMVKLEINRAILEIRLVDLERNFK